MSASKRNRPTAFTREHAQRIVKDNANARRRNRSQVRRPEGSRPGNNSYYATVTVQIEKRNGNTLGAGRVSLEVINIDDNGVATTSDIQTDFPCYSKANSPIAVGREIIVIEINGYLNVAADFCDAN